MTVKFKFHRSLKKSDVVFSGVVSFEILEDFVDIDYVIFDEECNCEIVTYSRFDTKDIRYISIKDGFYRYFIHVK